MSRLLSNTLWTAIINSMRSEDCVDIERHYSIKLLSTGHKLSVTDYASKKLEKDCDGGGKDFLLRNRSLDELISEIHEEMTGKVKYDERDYLSTFW